ncbi:MAG: hypothetical protein AAFR61_28065 [Bacteroidota bacterium]
MLKQLTVIFILFAHTSLPSLFAAKIIGDLDFNQGNWAIVGVPMHNYNMLPIQKELSTFISKDKGLMQDIQKRWDLEMTFEDKCDYHYSLKFYRNQELVRTVNLNLHCGYATYDGLSYTFNPDEFNRFKASAQEIPWSRISFSDLGKLKKAVNTLERSEEIYWYDDIKPYEYGGFFMLTVGDLAWNTNLDSLHQAVRQKLSSYGRSPDFYLKMYYYLVQGDYMTVRYFINCDQPFASRVNKNAQMYMPWRSHLHNKDQVSIVAIGVDENRYWRLINR